VGRNRLREWAQDEALGFPSDPSIFLLQDPRGIDMGLAKERCFRLPPAPIALALIAERRGARQMRNLKGGGKVERAGANP
jgi:hypothetical protein